MNTQKFIKKLDKAIDCYLEFNVSERICIEKKVKELLIHFTYPINKFAKLDRVLVNVLTFHTCGKITDTEYIESDDIWMYEVNGDWYNEIYLTPALASDYINGDVVIYNNQTYIIEEVALNFYEMMNNVINNGYTIPNDDTYYMEINSELAILRYTKWALITTIFEPDTKQTILRPITQLKKI